MICPALEPKRSGVGDYARRLAGELALRGEEMLLVGWNDSFVEAAALQHEDGLRVLRLPPKTCPEAKRKAIHAGLNGRPPDWVSLQFVSYGYHRKGLPFGLASCLCRLRGQARVQVMFHELWCGGRGSRWRDRIYGLLQRWIIRNLIHRLHPVLLHTHATPYLESLRRLRKDALQLPLFSNIPVPEQLDFSQSFDTWLHGVSGFSGATERVVFCHFGTLYSPWQPEALLRLLRSELAQTGTRGLVLAIGHLGEKGQDAWNRLQAQGDDQLRFVALGSLAEADVARCFRRSAYGISTTPPDLIEKSAAAAAMMAHGLPILASRPPIYGVAMLKRVEARQPLLIAGKRLASFREVQRATPDRTDLTRVADQFLSDLHAAELP